MVKIAHSLGITVEGEIGHVGEAGNNDNNTSDMYTTPQEAIDFVSETGVDALAIAIGTAHGVYKSTPKLDLERLRDIRKSLDTPLVLHGGSGLSDQDFKNSIHNGITKINICTDLYIAGMKAISAGGTDYHDIRRKKVDVIKQAIIEKIVLFESNGRA